ncbi:MAG: zinc-binding alcohol dehydrogenase [Xanthobacteraceae bacterium]|jgi:alcohol dehydrogenase|nr:zinc-binding alcohol dehydrogenase [Xanthobacteraceae bacterium]
MKAAVIERQGGLENLVYRDWPTPERRTGEALVRVRACGLNHLDIFVRRGMPGFPVPVPFISGGDIAGEIAEVGSEAGEWKVGDRVVMHPVTHEGMMGEEIPGGMAEYVRVSLDNLIRLPDTVGFDVAAAVPIAFGTSIRMLFEIGQIKPTDLILVLGASGGVGVACIQLAKMIGARVIAAAGSAEKCDSLRQLGADHTINYAEQEFSREAWKISGKQGVDVVINYTGGDTWVPSLKTMKPRGKLLTCGATAGFETANDMRFIWVRELQILGSNGYSKQDIATAIDHVAAGRVTPVISHRLPLSEAREAERLMEQRQFIGKIILEA